MGNLVIQVRQASDREFQSWLSTVTDEDDRAQLIAIREGLKKREEYIAGHDIRFLPFMTNKEKMEFIKACYGWVFAKIQREFPFIAEPSDDVSSFNYHMIDIFFNHQFLPEDQKMLMLA